MCRQRAAGSAVLVRSQVKCELTPGAVRARTDVISYGSELASGWVLTGYGHAQRQCSFRAAQSHLVCEVFLFVRLQSASILANHVLGRREPRQRGSKASAGKTSGTEGDGGESRTT